MALDLIALAILAAFGLMGALRGGIASAMGLFTLVLSYAVAVWAAQNLGEATTQSLGTSPLLGAPRDLRVSPAQPWQSCCHTP